MCSPPIRTTRVQCIHSIMIMKWSSVWTIVFTLLYGSERIATEAVGWYMQRTPTMFVSGPS